MYLLYYPFCHFLFAFDYALVLLFFVDSGLLLRMITQSRLGRPYRYTGRYIDPRTIQKVLVLLDLPRLFCGLYIYELVHFVSEKY